jgi:hypothetical protein
MVLLLFMYEYNLANGYPIHYKVSVLSKREVLVSGYAQRVNRKDTAAVE